LLQVAVGVNRLSPCASRQKLSESNLPQRKKYGYTDIET
jgi:hypothetical protein